MNKIYNDYQYMSLVNDILDNEKFKKIHNCKHHGLSRMEHSLRVSYYAYKLSKKLKLDYKATARAGLLHDFFINEDLKGRKAKFSMFFHPYKSLENSLQYFDITDKERDIIITHMFPTLPHKIPKYIESWLVSFVDKAIAIQDFYHTYSQTYLYKLSNLYMILLLFKR